MNCYYNDIYSAERPLYNEFPPMSRSDRAAQFASFAALTGYDDAVRETARYTDSRLELDEDRINELNSRFARLRDIVHERPLISVTYFMPDAKKAGGRYVTKTGEVRMIDSYENMLVFTDTERVPISEIYSLTIKNDITQE